MELATCLTSLGLEQAELSEMGACPAGRQARIFGSLLEVHGANSRATVTLRTFIYIYWSPIKPPLGIQPAVPGMRLTGPSLHPSNPNAETARESLPIWLLIVLQPWAAF